MNAQVAVVAQATKNRIRNAADAQLQRRAVGRSAPRRARRCEALHLVGARLVRQFQQRARRLHQLSISLTCRMQSPQVRGIRWFTSAITYSRCALPSACSPRPCPAQVAVLVGRTSLQQYDIQRHLARNEQTFDLTQEDGRIIGPPRLDRLAYVAAQKKSAVTEVCRRTRGACRVRRRGSASKSLRRPSARALAGSWHRSGVAEWSCLAVSKRAVTNAAR